MVAGAQGRFCLEILSLQAKLLQPLGLNPAASPLLEVRQGAPSPQRERLSGEVCRPLRVSLHQMLPRLFDETLEPYVVQIVGMATEAVALRQGLNCVGAQMLSQADHAALDDLRP